MTAHIKVSRDKYPVKLEMTEWMAGRLAAGCWTARVKFPNSELSTVMDWLRYALMDAAGVVGVGVLDTRTEEKPINPV